MTMQGWTSDGNFSSGSFFFFLNDRGEEGEEGALCGLVLLQRRDVQRGRGPAAPLLQLAVLEEEVEGWQGDAGLGLRLTQRVGHAAVRVRWLGAILLTRRGQKVKHQEENDVTDKDEMK